MRLIALLLALWAAGCTPPPIGPDALDANLAACRRHEIPGHRCWDTITIRREEPR